MVAINNLKQGAVSALRKGKYRKALHCYKALEKAEPQSGDWPRRIAEILKRLGEPSGALQSLERAMEKYERGGFAAKANAVSRMILQLDPYHDVAFKRGRTPDTHMTGPNLASGSRQDIPVMSSPVDDTWPVRSGGSQAERLARVLSGLKPKS
jgi:hypothetical protein